MSYETVNLTNTEYVKVEQAADKFTIFTGASKLFLQDTDQGAIVQGVDKDGLATIARFRTAKVDDLTIKAKLIDPNSPAGVTSTPSTPATEATPPTK